MKRILLLLCTVVMTLTASAYEKVSLNVKVNGVSRNMLVFLPNVKQDNMPLMIVTHGMNQDPEYQSDNDRLYEMVDTAKFVAAYLRSSGNTWETGGTGDQNFVENAIVELYYKYNIDRHRVYWSGFSMGSMLIYHSIHNMLGKIAAFAPTSGIQFSEQPWTKCKKPINLLHCHSAWDATFHIEGNPGQYDYTIQSYVAKMATVNKNNTYTKKTSYRPIGVTNYTADLETWKSSDGHVVKFMLYYSGAHVPQRENKREIWNFCKQFSLTDDQLDPLPEKVNYEYSLSDDNEFKSISRLAGLNLIVTDVDKQTFLYNNGGLDSPQNTRTGGYEVMQDNEYYYMKFTKVSNPSTSLTGNFYTIQMTNSKGEYFSAWSNTGHLNTPPGSWCLFALGLNNQYGQDAKNYGLWQVSYEAGNGFVIRNVGATEAGEENTYLSTASATPVKEKTYLRFYTKMIEKVVSGIDDVESGQKVICNDNKVYDLTGRAIPESQMKTNGLYIRNGRKFVCK